ncbi:hypothetical protein CC80DRAFT_481968 [Byssothecium circinans]|uniref:F-box domain-containing protein n=1 Tax=Byssothecium circinans TaxID=147558 RepID=A0A6A5TDT0_9PLEO|nr:hypothetical protein CC80DRAFT_481968 [Byssothecium circinans]
MAALDVLPNELLSLVANHLDRPRDITNIALCSRRLNEFVKLDGWKAFLRGRFGVVDLDLDAKNSVHGLATLYRNWDRKAFIARYLEPSQHVTSLNSWESKRWRGPQGQTMGFQPSIDSYEEMHGAWTERREVLTWSAGTQLVLRIKDTGANTSTSLSEHGQECEGSELDVFKHSHSWYTYKISDSLEGRDDITALNLLRPHQKDPSVEHIVFGTASSQLCMLNVDLERRRTTEHFYEAGQKPVGSLSISSKSQPLMATTLGDSSLALYAIDEEDPNKNYSHPLSEVMPTISGSRTGRLWSCNFISNETVAVGLGPSPEPIQVYEITPTGYTAEPLRKFSLDSKYWAGTVDVPIQRHTSIYPIIPIPSNAEADSAVNHLFLSGGYDGIVRLHDMRSPHSFETLFWDVTNDSSIYSLACQGQQRFVVGSSMHSMLKVFDLRFPGSHAYHATSVTAKPQSKRQDYMYNAIVDRAGAGTASFSGGWNVFLNARNPIGQNGGRGQNGRPGPRREDSPVYSLSIPSATSLNLYAGLEGVVQNLTFVSVLDQHPDPLLALSATHSPDMGHIDLKDTYDPSGDVLNLGMYEQGTEEGLGMQLLIQDDISTALLENQQRKEFARHRGLDERWKDPSEDGERWARGQQPQGNSRRGGGRGRGRGRGRGGRGRG